MVTYLDEGLQLMQDIARGQSKAVSTIRDTVERAASRLRDAGVEDPRQDAWLLIAHVLRRDRATLLAHAHNVLGAEDRQAFEHLVARRAGREPFAQIVGRREFWSLDFHITSDVLCPRPDSECLIEASLAEIERRHPFRGKAVHILDLGTGSGCLLLTLLKELPQATGIGVDVSSAALSIASGNGQRLGLSERVSWLRSNWASALDGRFDLIIGNPPYIPEAAKPTLSEEVRGFEPASALFAGDDGLDGYRAFASDLGRLLAPSGFVCLEIGQGQADLVEGILCRHGFCPLARRRDLGGVERCLLAELC